MDYFPLFNDFDDKIFCLVFFSYFQSLLRDSQLSEDMTKSPLKRCFFLLFSGKFLTLLDLHWHLYSFIHESGEFPTVYQAQGRLKRRTIAASARMEKT